MPLMLSGLALLEQAVWGMARSQKSEAVALWSAVMMTS